MEEKKNTIKKKYKVFSIIIIIILVIIGFYTYRSVVLKTYEEAKKLNSEEKYIEASIKINKLPLIFVDEEVEEDIKIIKLKNELGSYKQNAKSMSKDLNSDYLDTEEVLPFWTSSVSYLYTGLEKSINYKPTNEKERNIKNEFITTYYYNLYINLPRGCLYEKFIIELNNMNYNERKEKIEQIAKDYIPTRKLINKFAVYEPTKDFKNKLFDYNNEFHYPTIKFRDEKGNHIESDYLINEYRNNY